MVASPPHFRRGCGSGIAVAGGGALYVPTPALNAAVKVAGAPGYDWFKGNVANGEEIFTALTDAVAEAEAEVGAARDADLN